jgi:hypothetical protein
LISNGRSRLCFCQKNKGRAFDKMNVNWMNRLQMCLWRLWIISILIFCAAACTPANVVVEEAVTREVAVGETAVSSAQLPTPTSEQIIKTEPTLVPTIAVTQTPIPTPTPQVPLPQELLITDEPVFVGGDLQFAGWSPDGRYLAYFEYTEEQVAESPVEGLRGTYPGTFVFYDTQTGEKCSDYPISAFFSYEGAGSGSQWRWLPDGQLLLSLPDGQLLQSEAPCVAGENIAPLFAGSISSIGDVSPDEQWLILVSVGQYWLYHWSTQNAHPIAEVQVDAFNNMVWSPDSQHISITLAGNYTGDRSPVGGTRVIDVATGEIIARHDWEPANALDGTFGGPVWINNNEFVVTLSLDQGPFLMHTNGEVRPLLPLFDETFERGNYWPPLDVYAEVENGRYAILRGHEGRELAARLYTFTPEGESVEIFEQTFLSFRIFPDGTVGYEENGRFLTRPVFETGDSFSEQPSAANPWLPIHNNLLATSNAGYITVYDRSIGSVTERLQVAGYEVGYILNPILSPNDQWLATFINEPKYSLGKALFVIPVPSQ